MKQHQPNATNTAILDVAAQMLERRGLDGLQLRDVAAEAKVSLSTVYKDFPSRDDLVVAAVEHWMVANVYRTLSPPPDTGSLADDLVVFLRDKRRLVAAMARM